MVPLGSLLPPVLLLAAGFAPTSPFRPMLFMDAEDTADGWGLMEPQASSVVPNAAYRPPPLPYQLGSLVISVMESASHPGSWEVYAENTTGWFVPAPPPPPPSHPETLTARAGHLQGAAAGRSRGSARRAGRAPRLRPPALHHPRLRHLLPTPHRPPHPQLQRHPHDEIHRPQPPGSLRHVHRRRRGRRVGYVHLA